jgi:NAD(P)-dependent dehydrogenase (short-subunit alcohol dehydrogenase family)
MLLKDKITLITGASGGIGQAIAKAMALEGATIILSDLKQELLLPIEKALVTAGNKVESIEIDVSSVSSIENGIQEVCNKYGRIDILINNAGICKIRPALEITPEDWDLVLDINLKGVFFCSQIAAKQMIKQNCGKIINIASNAGKVGFPDQADYNASKAGVINLTRSLAEEWAQYGINVNAICPGAVNTKMLVDIADLISTKINADSEKLLDSFAPKQLGRLIDPSEIGQIVVFLSSDNAVIIRGQAINVDAGSTPY